MPFVSIVVTATDLQAPYLAECLDSIRAQTRGQFEVVVVPYGRSAGCVAVAEGYSAADWRFAIAPAQDTYGSALNAGARRAMGEYLTFVGAADTLPEDACEVLVGTLQASGSDFVVGNLADAAPAKHLVRSEHARAHRQDRTAVTIADEPDALADTFVGNRLFRRAFWKGAQLGFPERSAAQPGLPIERAYVQARSFDLLHRVTYHLTRRGDGVPFGYLRPVSPGLHEWRAEQRRISDELSGTASTEVRDAWLYAVLDIGIKPYIGDAERLDERDWAMLRDAASDLLSLVSADAWRRVRPESRVGVWLAAHGMRTHLEDFVAQRWFENGQYATVVRDGSVYAWLPYAGEGDELDVPTACYELTERETVPVVSVQRINWSGDALQIDLFCYVTNVSMRDARPEVDVALVRAGERLPMEVRVDADPAVTRHAGQPYQNYDNGSVRAELSTTALAAAERGDWTLEVTIAVDGITRTSSATQLGWQGSAAALRAHRGDTVAVTPRWSDTGLVAAVADPNPEPSTVPRRFVIDEVILDGTTIDVVGTWSADPPADWELAIESGETRLDGSVCAAQADRHQVRIGAVYDPWSMGERPAPPGAYHVRCVANEDGAERTFPVVFADALLDRLPYDELGDTYRLRLRRSPQGGPVFELGTPLGPQEQGPYAQAQLQQWYAGEHPIDEGAVYLQSYVGQSATDSPLALHHALRERRPDLTLHWGVADRSQWVPDGAVPVVMRSRRWYEVLATARYIVSNIDFERWFVPREGQQVMQTYHGFPSKTMGVGLWREKQFTPRRIEQQLARTSYLWGALLTPTPEVNRYYRESFRYHGTILDRGYPRDDALAATGAPEVRAAVRERLGIRAGQTAVLYAPTWRDDVATGYRSAPLVPHLDVRAAAGQLGDDVVILLRGHRFNESSEGLAGKVVDVTTYPEINDLILASDAAVLDYSSMRFDYAVTRKPMIFLVPDLDEYTGGVRGFLYDFRGTAPGPLVTDTDAVVAELRRLDQVAATHGDAYDSFNATYNRWQDGRAAERVVDAFFAPR
ncbi:MAG: bifunctional glycosyltransferase/CDP-glycerol:glycerophosphate glycerophosphotransferase [Nocardioidaceae bacterium]